MLIVFFTRTTSFTTMFTVINCGVFIEKHVYTKFRLDWRLCTWPYRNIWPEAIYCCFTRTTLFTKLFTCLYDQS